MSTLDLQNLTLPSAAPDRFQVSVQFEGRDLRLRFVKKSHRTPDFRILLTRDGTVVDELEPPPVRTYEIEHVDGIDARGVVRGWAALNEGRLDAGLVWNDGQERSIGIAPARISPSADPSNSSVHAIYDKRHQQLPPIGCGTHGEPEYYPPAGEQGGTIIARVAAVLDGCFVVGSGVNGGNDISQAIFNADSLHAAENLEYGVPGIDIQHQVAAYIVETQTPPDCTVPGLDSTWALVGLATDWINNYAPMFPQVVNVQLFSGQRFSDFSTNGTIGLAYIGTICDPNYSFAVNDMSSSFLPSNAALLSHERGHNWNAGHCDGTTNCGIMRSSIQVGLPFGPLATSQIANFSALVTCTGAPGLTLPFSDGFSTQTFNGDYWSRVVLADLEPNPLDPSDTMVALHNPGATSLGFGGALTTELFDLGSGAPNMNGIKISFEMYAPSPAQGSFLELEVRNRNGSWERLDIVRTEVLNQGAVTTPFESVLRWDEVHYEDLQLRFRARNLGAGQTLYIDDIDVSFESMVSGLISEAGVMATGDINRDGKDDVVMGLPSDAGFQGTVQVRLSGTNQVASFTGLLPFEALGTSVAVLGDLNQDGFPEIAAGGPGFQSGSDGVVRVFSGAGLAQQPPVLTELMAPATGMNLEGFGSAVTGLGLVDADAVPDFAVGAPMTTNGAGQQVGAVHVHSGATGARIPGATVLGEVLGDRFGETLSSVQNPGVPAEPHLVVGMRYVPTSTPRTGYVKVFSGSLQGGTLPLLRRIDHNSVLSQLEGNLGDPRFGYEVEGLGDFDGDGLSDIAIGIIGTRRDTPSGPVKASGHVLVTSATASNTPDVLIPGEAFEGIFGASIAAAGDLNQDGLADFLVGDGTLSREFPPNGVLLNGGGIYAMVGPSGTLNNFPGPGERYFLVDYAMTGGTFKGRYVGAGDLDGDGRMDLLESAQGSDSTTVYQGYTHSSLFDGAAPGTAAQGEPRPPFLRLIDNSVSGGVTLDVCGLPQGGIHHFVFGDSVLNNVGFLGLDFLANPQVSIPITPDSSGNYTFSFVPPTGAGAVFHQILTSSGSAFSGSNVILGIY